MKQIIMAALILFLLISCSLSRKNPLDPDSHNVSAPGKVTGIQVSVTGSNTVYLQWEALSDADGYYIYRSQSYDGAFPLIKEVEVSDITTFEDVNVEIATVGNENFYWYKLSAYLLVDGEKLEGYRSEAHSW